jgi:hypothetical protein
MTKERILRLIDERAAAKGHRLRGWTKARSFHTVCMKCGRFVAVRVTKGPESAFGNALEEACDGSREES